MLKKNAPYLNRNLGLNYTRSYTDYRADAYGCGYSHEMDPVRYQWDNRNRLGGWLLQYTLGGAGEFHDYTQKKTVPVRSGTAILVPFPSLTGYGLPQDGAWEFLYVCFFGDAAEAHASRIVQRFGHLLDLAADGDAIGALWHLIRLAAAAEPSSVDPCQPQTGSAGVVPDEKGMGIDEATVNLVLHQILLTVEHELCHPRSALPEPVAKACHRIATGFSDPLLDVRQIAEVSGLSRYHFSRLFRQATGQAPHAYLFSVRIREATRLLTQTGLPVKEIALRCGFSDSAYFCNAFRRHTGHAPGVVRARHRELMRG